MNAQGETWTAEELQSLRDESKDLVVYFDEQARSIIPSVRARYLRAAMNTIDLWKVIDARAHALGEER